MLYILLIGIILAFGFAVFGFWTGSIVLVSITGNSSETVSLIGGIIGMIIGILVGISPAIVIIKYNKHK